MDRRFRTYFEMENRKKIAIAKMIIDFFTRNDRISAADGIA